MILFPKQCLHCQITFEATRGSRKQRSERKFCSWKCAWEHKILPLSTALDRYIVNEKTGCFEWSGAKSSLGYGTIGRSRRKVLAHRLSYENAFGPIPEGMCVLHRCDNPKCINTEHLFLGTKKDNSQDMARKRRNAGAFPEKSGSRLSSAAIRDIYTSPDRGVDLAARYGVSKSNISMIKSGKLWRHVSGAADG